MVGSGQNNGEEKEKSGPGGRGLCVSVGRQKQKRGLVAFLGADRMGPLDGGRPNGHFTMCVCALLNCNVIHKRLCTMRLVSS